MNIKSMLFGGAAAAEPPTAQPSETARKVASLIATRASMQAVVETERRRCTELRARAAQKEAARVQALADAKLGTSALAVQRAGEIAAECAKLRQEADDAELTAANIEERLAGLDRELTGLKNAYRSELAVFLDQLWAQAIERYNALAPEVAEAIAQVAATRRVMIALRAGNTNGWRGEALLPGMDAFNGRAIPPLLEAGSTGFSRAAEARTEAIYDKLRAAGLLARI